MMEAAFRPAALAGARPGWREPFARTIDAAKKYVVSSTLERVFSNSSGSRVRLAGHGPTLFAGLSKGIDLRVVSRVEFSSGAVAMRYEPSR
jgi:hypothetical protein